MLLSIELEHAMLRQPRESYSVVQLGMAGSPGSMLAMLTTSALLKPGPTIVDRGRRLCHPAVTVHGEPDILSVTDIVQKIDEAASNIAGVS
jgi:hypothetical protein